MTFRRQDQLSKKPVVSKVNIFDSLLTISSLTKALAEEVMLLKGDANEGGEKDESKDTLDLSSE